MPRKNILFLLEGGDRRSIGRSDQVAALVANDVALFPELIAGLWAADPLVRMRASDALEKATRSYRELLQPYKKKLLCLMAEAKQPEIRWHLAVIIPRLRLSARERRTAVSALNSYLLDHSSIVKTFALQGLADLTCHEPALWPEVKETLRDAARSGTPAMRARSRKLLTLMEHDELDDAAAGCLG